MKTIGLLGGVTWHSTLKYYQYINEITGKILGKDHSAKLIIYSFSFEQIKALQKKNDMAALSLLLKDKAGKLKELGAELLLICANTLHMYFQDIEDSVDIKIIHIADAVAEYLVKNEIKTVGLLGTRYTMEKDFYKNRLLDNFGIKTIIPDSDDREMVNQIIYEELIAGIFNQKSRNIILRIMDEQIRSGAEAIVLGCTELPLLIEQKEREYPLLNTTLLHAESAVRQSIQLILSLR